MRQTPNQPNELKLQKKEDKKQEQNNQQKEETKDDNKLIKRGIFTSKIKLDSSQANKSKLH